MSIPGKKSPGMNIDVFLRPLIEELKALWNTWVDCRDVKEKKTLHYVLCWFGQSMTTCICDAF
jgi:hypothetical protein